jgi:3-oxoacyl-[acyl-carrier-protein] synthase II
MRLALGEAALPAAAIGYINAHGSSTPLNDPTESQAIRQVFGAHADRVAVSGTKGYTGHALGASGAIEAAICALAAHREWLPPTVNLAEPGDGCDLPYLIGTGTAASPEYLMSNSFGFGGINAVLVLGSGKR